MADQTTLKDAVATRGPYAVWDLMTDDEKTAASRQLWTQGDQQTRTAIEVALAKEMKFRPQSLRKVSADRIVARLVRMADTLPDTVLFQFLFHLHLGERRHLLAEFLDGIGLPHDDGVLELPEDATDPDPEAVTAAADNLVVGHGHEALVYLATLYVADDAFWAGVGSTLNRHDEAGEEIAKPKPAEKTGASSPATKKSAVKK
jgi:hypothetical protein